MRPRRSRSRSSRVARLYVAKRRAKPMVRASGSSTSSARVDFATGKRRGAEAGPAGGAGEGHQPLPAALVGAPQLLGGDASPPAVHSSRVGMLLAPLRAQVAVVELVHLVRDPGAEVHAVGDVSRWESRPPGHPARWPSTCRAADLAVQLADAVAGGGHAQRQHGHAELLRIVGRILAAQRRGTRCGEIPSARM